MTEAQFCTLLKGFNSVIAQMFDDNVPLYIIAGYVIIMCWVYQLGENENTLVLRKYMRSYYDTGSFQFDPEPSSEGHAGNYL